jgi:PAS domain S-box-containing protein
MRGDAMSPKNRPMNAAASDLVVADGQRVFEAMADAAPVMIWQSGPDKLTTYFNRLWLEFTGRTLEQERGNGWAEGVHPHDLERCLATYGEAFDARRDFDMEYRLRRHDGEYRWILDRGRPLYGSSGEFLGYVGGCIDITDRKRGEAERQVEIQDFALQMFFVIALVARAALADLPPEAMTDPPAVALVEILGLASTGTAQIRDAIAVVSHAEVVERGLVPALRRLARGFHQRTGIEAAVVLTGPETPMATEVAERLHTVAREALANVERTSGARSLALALRMGRRSVSLSIEDDQGFVVRARVPLRDGLAR